MKPAQLIPPAFALAWLAQAPGARAQTTPKADAAPAATAPAPPPAPQSPAPAPSAPPPATGAPAAAPAPADLPPPPPPRGSAPPPPQGNMVISAPPVPPATPRAGYHTHDGFYLRAALGLGGGHINVSTDSKTANNFSFGGGGISFDGMVGFTPWRGVAIGGLLGLQTIAESSTRVDGQRSGQQLDGTTLLLGPMIDVFPDPLRGLHFGGSLDLAAIGAKAKSKELDESFKVKDYNASGLGGSLWVGYMGFVGANWSMGGMLQLSGLRAQEDKDDVKRLGTGYTVSLNFSALYH